MACLPMVADLAARAPRAAAVIVGEPSRMRVVTGHKGGLGFDTAIRGFPVHSSMMHRGVNAIMIISDGGGPTTMQRGKMNDLLEEMKFQGKVAVVTVKSMVRGIVTAISWFNPGIKAFSTLQIPAALKYLDFSDAEHGVILAEIQRLKQRLGME